LAGASLRFAELLQIVDALRSKHFKKSCGWAILRNKISQQSQEMLAQSCGSCTAPRKAPRA
jgi:hypothetical protein